MNVKFSIAALAIALGIFTSSACSKSEKTERDRDVGIRSDAKAAVDARDDDSAQDDAGDETVCNSTKPLLDELYFLCDKALCVGYQIRARLFLGFGNDPFSWGLNDEGNLVLKDIRDEIWLQFYGDCFGIAGTYMKEIGFRFNYGEVFDESLVPGIKPEPEWKVEIENALIEYHTAQTMVGSTLKFSLRGSLNDVAFVKDTKDELPPFIEVRDEEGNLVADIR
ncbi:MAG: hypothetical protein JXA30_09585 [Deltaproteobacteria bacterium]|nr:hypothetical protein [Deltaproteobacteria bacterium]